MACARCEHCRAREGADARPTYCNWCGKRRYNWWAKQYCSMKCRDLARTDGASLEERRNREYAANRARYWEKKYGPEVGEHLMRAHQLRIASKLKRKELRQ